MTAGAVTLGRVTEDELLEGLKRQDRRAIDAFLNTHQGGVFRFGLRMCRHRADAEDVLQETLITALKEAPKFRGEAKLSTWLFQIARSVCARRRRRHAGEPAQFDALSAAPQVPAEGDVHGRTEAKELLGLTEAALQKLPPEHREPILLCDVEGLSTQEGADAVGIQLRAFKSRLHRARVALKATMADALEQQEDGESCEQLVKLLEKPLDPATCQRMVRHVEHCQACSDACARLKDTALSCRRLAQTPVPKDVKVAVREATQAFAAVSTASAAKPKRASPAPSKKRRAQSR